MTYENYVDPTVPQLPRLLAAYEQYKARRGDASEVRERLIRGRKCPVPSMQGILEMIQSREGCEVAAYESVLIAELLGSIDAFTMLPIQQKWAVFKRFWSRFLLFDDIGRRFQGDYDEYQRRLACGIEPVYPCGPVMDPKFNAMRMQLIVIPLGDLHLDRLEFVSMFAITLWSLEGRETIDETTLGIAADEKLRIFNELHAHYVQTRPAFEAPNYAARIASMSAILHTLDTFISQRRDDVKTLMMINAIDGDEPPEILGIVDMP